MRLRFLTCLFFGGLLALSAAARGAEADALVRDALAAEAKLDCKQALELFLAADRARPNDPFILQKISRQYSDSTVDTTDLTEKRRLAAEALVYAKRADQLAPNNAVNVLSLAICYGKIGLFSDTRTKIENARHVREYAERALALDPAYDWAYHVLGRWHYEVAELGATKRFLVRLIYGGLPDASPTEAVRLLERAVALAPDALAHHIELGFALLATDQRDRARAEFERGLALPSREKHDEETKARARAALEKLK